MAMILFGAVTFAQNDKKEKEIKKKKTMMITMTVDEDGETTKVDTIVFRSPDVHFEEIMKDLDIQMDMSKDRMKEIQVEVLAEMDELQNSFHFEFKDKKEELNKAMEELKRELEQLNIEKEAQERIKEAMEKIEQAGEHSRKHIERFVFDDAHPVFFGEDGKYEIIVDEDGENVKTEVIWVDEDGKVSKKGEKELKVWVDSDKNKKVVIRSDGKKIVEGENIFVYEDGDSDEEKVIMLEMSGAGLSVLSSTKEKDIEKAIKAGLPIDKDNMLEEMDIFVEIKDGEDAIIKLKSNEEGKLKATAYDEDFKKLKKLKVTEEDGAGVIQLETDDLKDSGVRYLLLEQAGKTDLIKIHR